MYDKLILVIINDFDKKGMVRTVSADRPIDSVYKDVEKLIKSILKEE